MERSDAALMTPDADEARRRNLRSMKGRATGLLVLAAAVFVVSRLLEGDHGWAGYVRATAEAAMVGGLADWFAVTALFRHPLRLPIPHTAIIPRRKDQLGESLGRFVEDNFLSDEIIAEKLQGRSIARRAAEWAIVPPNRVAVSRHAGAGLHGALDVLRDDDVQDAVEAAVLSRVRSIELAPMAGRALEVLTAGDRHQEVLDAALGGLVRFLEEHRDELRARFGRESPWWLPESVDDRIFDKVYAGLRSVLDDVTASPRHELREYLDRRLAELAVELQHSPELRARGEELKEELLAHPAVRRLTVSLWGDLKRSLQDQSSDPESELRRRAEAAIGSIAEAVLDDPALADKIDQWVQGAVRYIVGAYRHEVAEIIAATVAKWDPHEAARRIELQVGRDLQFIRINGTVVGGLAGLAIHTFGQLIA
jgi:uncharacterized membrane-anchored protein YjiN (DUF445 family)